MQKDNVPKTATPGKFKAVVLKYVRVYFSPMVAIQRKIFNLMKIQVFRSQDV